MNEDEKLRQQRIANTRRIAMGLPPLTQPQPAATQRMTTGNTQRVPQVDPSWAINPQAGYRPGATMRLAEKQIKEKRRLNKYQLGLVLTVPVLVIATIGFFLIGGNTEQQIHRQIEDFRSKLEQLPGMAGSTETAPGAGESTNTTPNGKTFRNHRYATGNIQTVIPLEQGSTAAPATQEKVQSVGGKRVAPGVDPAHLPKDD
jgi:hypothetical protein